MSNPNENIQPYQSRELVNIDETGRVVINNPELGKMTDELSLEELEAVSGSGLNIHCPTTTNSSQCQCPSTREVSQVTLQAE